MLFNNLFLYFVVVVVVVALALVSFRVEDFIFNIVILYTQEASA